ncbi:uncharacterized protein DUF4154 [Stella humosa]|uniref:Uncharacterized protein DUF4154 n=1 Tax=Stella humosa TaxID=94 RepID=A0A3N1MES6_9PROT|nr:YfiR family protein [Stella humosa]ROP99675.1 uncharacterized protein DUF4154 [Stella humosa]BBK31100.1 hypothetical protein STHU_17340 [Stella humosa]
MPRLQSGFTVSNRTALVALGLIAALSAGSRAEGQTPSAQPVDARAGAMWAIVRGIISYTRWPADPDPVRLCVVGRSDDAADWPATTRTTPGRTILVTRFAAPDPGIGQACDAVHVGELAEGELPHLMSAIAGRPILTVFERDPACRSGGMFCLRTEGDRLAFQMNLDAVARSGTRVNPRVLRLARPPEQRS